MPHRHATIPILALALASIAGLVHADDASRAAPSLSLTLALWGLVFASVVLTLRHRMWPAITICGLAVAAMLIERYTQAPSWAAWAVALVGVILLAGTLMPITRVSQEGLDQKRLAVHAPALDHWRPLLLSALASGDERLTKKEMQLRFQEKPAMPEDDVAQARALLEQFTQAVQGATHYGPEQQAVAGPAGTSSATGQALAQQDPFSPHSLIAIRTRLLSAARHETSTAIPVALAPAREVAEAMPYTLQQALQVSGYHDALRALKDLLPMEES